MEKRRKKYCWKSLQKQFSIPKEEVAGAKSMEFTENRILGKETESTVIGVQDQVPGHKIEKKHGRARNISVMQKMWVIWWDNCPCY